LTKGIFDLPEYGIKDLTAMTSLIVHGIEHNKPLTQNVWKNMFHLLGEHIGICRACLPKMGTDKEKELNQYAIAQAEMFMQVATNIIDPKKGKMFQYNQILSDMLDELCDTMENVMSIEKMPATYKYYKQLNKMLVKSVDRSPVPMD